jgi:hypothetical protein
MSAKIIYRDHAASGRYGSFIGRAMGRIGRRLARQPDHAALDDFDDHMLRDIGLTRVELHELLRQR